MSYQPNHVHKGFGDKTTRQKQDRQEDQEPVDVIRVPKRVVE
jgi:Transposase